MTDRITIFIYLFTSALNTMSVARLFRHKAAETPVFLKEVAAYIAFYLITTIAFLTFGIPMLNLILNLVGFFLLAGLYEKKTKKNILIAVLTYVAMVLAEMIAMWVSGFVPQSVWEQ
ncbi:MAG: hypothetical protein J6Y48_18685, partial [Clostridia bacterium]|nr:hypothetical protein [Clostridia bacterium]